MPSRFIPINPAADTSQQVSIINKNFAELDNEGTIKLYSDKTGTPNISIGIQPDGTSRIKVAKTGFDVTTATNDQLAFNSSQNTLKVVASGLIDITTPFPVITGPVNQSYQTIVTSIAHGLGYTPVVLTYLAEVVNGSVNGFFPFSFGSIYSSGFGSNFSNIYTAQIDVTSTNLSLGLTRSCYLASGVSTAPFSTNPLRWRYILLQESIV